MLQEKRATSLLRQGFKNKMFIFSTNLSFPAQTLPSSGDELLVHGASIQEDIKMQMVCLLFSQVKEVKVRGNIL